MAGEARTDAFMLSTATVMVGAVEDLYDLNPMDHSLGLVKNFRMTSEPSYTELTQGVKNQMVASVMTANPVRASMEVYEYTKRNLSYSLGLEGGAVSSVAPVETQTSAPASATDTSITVADETGFVVDDFVMVQNGNDDQVVVRKLSAVTPGSLEFTQALPKDIATGAGVYKSNTISVGSKENQPFLAAFIVGKLADGTPVTVQLPKVRVTAGFSLGFVTENFDNMPFEFTIYDQVLSDPYYADFNGEPARLIMNK